MAASYTSWGTRRALGRRYAIDPALLLENERLQQEYAAMPGREARALQAGQFDRSMTFNQEQADLNRKSSEKAGITGTVGNVATTAALGYFMKGGGATPAVTPGVTGAYSTGATAVPAGTFQTGGTAPIFTEGMTQTVSPALTDTTLALSEGAGSVGSATGSAATGAAAEGASLAGAGSAAMTAAPYAAAGYLGAKYGGKLLENMAGGPDSSNTFAKMGRTMQTPFEGIGRPWLRQMGKETETTKTIMNVLNPIGAVVEKACIIVTACTSPDSDEVNITREYRDRFLDQDQLSGYYRLASIYVPQIRKRVWLKKATKRFLVDRLVAYGKVKLGKPQAKATMIDEIISKAFLTAIKIIGFVSPRFVRESGEAY